MFREGIYFIAFTIFLLLQVCIWVASTSLVEKIGFSGQAYWCVTIVVFLIINEFVFGNFSYFESDMGGEDDDRDWLNETEL